MVPLKIEIKNFLSYGEPSQIIDFANYNLICLSGKNGNGKSSLIEALTWALWGQARKSNAASKPDYHLVNAGKNHMIVIFDFKVGLQEYQIKREFLKNLKKPLSNLELSIKNNNKLEDLSEKTIRHTQEKINSILKIDYETFVNSSYLRQANSNEFSKKSPKERKSILAKILNLSRYDQIAQSANDKEKLLDSQLKQNLAMQKQISEHLLKEDEILKKIEVAQENLEKENINLKEKEFEFLKIEKKLKSLEQEREKLKQQQNLAQEYEKQKSEIFSAVKKNSSKIKELEQKVNLKAKIDTKENIVFLTEKINRLEINREEKLANQQQLINLNKEFEIERSSLAEKSGIKKQEIHQQIQNLKIQSAQAEFLIKEKKSLIHEIEQENSKLQSQKTTQNTKSKELDLEKKLKRNLINFGEEKKSLEFYKNIAKNNTQSCNFLEKKICFSCNQKIENPQPFLDKLKKECLKSETLILETKENLEKLKHQILNQQNFIDHDKTSFLEEAKRVSAEENIKKNNVKVSCEKKYILKKEDELAKIKNEINKLAKTLANLELEESLSLSNDEKIKLIQGKIESISKKINSCSFDKKDFESTKEKIKLIEKAEKQNQEFLIIKKEINILSQNKENLEKILSNLTAKINFLAQPETQIFLKNFEQEKVKHEAIKMHIAAMKKKNIDLEKAISQLDAERTFLNRLKNNLSKLIEKFKELQSEINLYSELNLAFGKNGIQALLIENLIPEIEDETNFYLSKISDSKSKVYFESQKELKSGIVKESLEIKICDSKGVREYEMFSGGEAFRIDFAIRVGISKIVAKRAGASLQTLIIDEGFGSLDDEGIELLTSCIYSIAQDFEKVIIITHLTDFKNSFPVHFLVTKSARGSKINIELKG